MIAKKFGVALEDLPIGSLFRRSIGNNPKGVTKAIWEIEGNP